MSFKKDWKVRIEDMLGSISKIQRYLKGLDRESFCEDERTVDAVSRNLEIIGEAARKIPFDIVQLNPQIPWSKLAEMRNILIHEYNSVPHELIWRTVTKDIPPLIPHLTALLRE